MVMKWKITLLYVDASFRRRRKVFEDYAKENGFDPLIADQWYLQSIPKLRSSTVIAIFILYLFIILFYLFNNYCILINTSLPL